MASNIDPGSARSQTTSPVRHPGQLSGDSSDTGDPASRPANEAGQREAGNVDNPQPAQGGHAPMADVVGRHGGTDAAAGAQLSGARPPSAAADTQGADDAGAPGAPGGALQQADKDGRSNVAPGAEAIGGTAMGSTASAADTRTGTGSSSGMGTQVAGGSSSSGDPGMSRH